MCLLTHLLCVNEYPHFFFFIYIIDVNDYCELHILANCFISMLMFLEKVTKIFMKNIIHPLNGFLHIC